MRTTIHILIALVLLTSALPSARAQGGPKFRDALANAPKRGDGTADYAAVINAHYGKGVKNQDNAFIALLMVSEGERWDADHRAAVFAELKLDRPGADVPQFISFPRYIEQLPEAEREAADAQFEQSINAPWSDADCPHVAKWLKTNEPALDYIAKAMRLPKYYVPMISTDDPPLLVWALLPHLSIERAIARAFAVRAYRAIERGLLESAWQDVLTLKRMASHVSLEPTLIGGLVGMSIGHLAVNVSVEVAGHPKLTAAQAQRMIRQSAAIRFREPLVVKIALSERAMMIDTMQHLQRGTRMDRIYFDADEESSQPGLEWMFAPSYFDPALALERIHEQMDQAIAIMNHPTYREARDAGTRFSEANEARGKPVLSFLQSREEGERVGALPEAERRKVLTNYAADIWLALATPSLTACVEHEYRHNAWLVLETTAFALAAHRATHGTYPDKLDALVPAILAKAPIDPFTGEPLRYRVEAERVVLYSVGRDMEDNGGAEQTEASDEAFDLVVTLPVRRGE